MKRVDGMYLDRLKEIVVGRKGVLVAGVLFALLAKL